jgi:hypothetical protein
LSSAKGSKKTSPRFAKKELVSLLPQQSGGIMFPPRGLQEETFSEVTGAKAPSFRDLPLGRTSALSLSKWLRNRQNSPGYKSQRRPPRSLRMQEKAYSLSIMIQHISPLLDPRSVAPMHPLHHRWKAQLQLVPYEWICVQNAQKIFCTGRKAFAAKDFRRMHDHSTFHNLFGSGLSGLGIMRKTCQSSSSKILQ